ncbi:MAG: exodeoxyribonuclease VII small subunit [Actinomycetota bacterium]|nr:exodeoxyribonuclease VII small subunit [Actinomycetota bacterium]
MTDVQGAAPETLAFGEALAELEQIVASLEGGSLELEESLTRYERGVALLRALQAKLADAQQRVTTLIGEVDLSEESAADDDADGADG